ncbi:MAG: transcriptional regulator, DeoR family [Firmicutes bacterium]|nr:transcriptional regulator, DeoR family [Bacillota bacterium]
MEKAIELQRKIAPELLSVIEDRYNILRQVKYAEPVGRRALAAALDLGERVVRAQVDFLKSAGLIEFSPLGMTITSNGQTVLSDLDDYVRIMYGLSSLEQELAERLGLKKVVVIRGDSENDTAVQRELGRAAAALLHEYLGNNKIIAVSGGSTMALVAEAIYFHAPDVTVVPARGGLGEVVEYQANTIAAVMANKLGGRYRLLHIPEGLSPEAMAVLVRDVNVSSVAKLIREAGVLLSGIGQAAAMARRRGAAPEIIRRLEELGATGETFGHYCSLKGEVVYTSGGVGLHLDELADIRHVIAVAGGRKKAEAIVAVAAAGGQEVLVTDEAAARTIQDIIKKQL